MPNKRVIKTIIALNNTMKVFLNNKIAKVFLFLLIFSFVSTLIADNYEIIYANQIQWDNNLSEKDVSQLGGAFAPLVGIGGSPFIALTILSGIGNLLNSGSINPDNIPMSSSLMSLPIASPSVFTILLILTIVKFLSSMFGTSKILCDVTLGKIENILGNISALGAPFLLASATTVYATGVTTTNVASITTDTFFLTYAISFISAVFAYAVYHLMKTMLISLDVLSFLFSPIPGSAALFTIAKHIILSIYMWIAVINPVASMVIGIILVIIACLVFRAAKRLELYYRKIYLIPFFNALFRRGHRIPLIPKKLPRAVSAEFSEIDLCIEGFFMNRTSSLYKRELCYFIKSGEKNYIFKKRLFGKTIKFEIPNDAFIEKPLIFRFLRIFSDEELKTNKRRINLVVRREHGKNIEEIISKTGLIDYNLLLNERRRIKADEMALKMQQIKMQTTDKITSAEKKIKKVFGGLFSSKHKSEQSES